jgi:hypothetical protein
MVSLRTVRTGRIDATELVDDVLDQAPEDVIFAVDGASGAARTPFDVDTPGTLRADTRRASGDVRNRRFDRDNLLASLRRVDALRPRPPTHTTTDFPAASAEQPLASVGHLLTRAPM